MHIQTLCFYCCNFPIVWHVTYWLYNSNLWIDRLGKGKTHKQHQYVFFFPFSKIPLNKKISTSLMNSRIREQKICYFNGIFSAKMRFFFLLIFDCILNAIHYNIKDKNNLENNKKFASFLSKFTIFCMFNQNEIHMKYITFEY